MASRFIRVLGCMPRLSAQDWDQEVRHLELDLQGSDVTYEVQLVVCMHMPPSRAPVPAVYDGMQLIAVPFKAGDVAAVLPRNTTPEAPQPPSSGYCAII